MYDSKHLKDQSFMSTSTYERSELRLNVLWDPKQVLQQSFVVYVQVVWLFTYKQNSEKQIID